MVICTWSRYKGYQVSTKGDKRFSAFNAILPDGRSIEMHYQCDVKGYQPGGRNWKLGKGKPPLNPNIDLWEEYYALWKTWAFLNKALIEELLEIVKEYDGMLADVFATTEINQARALASVLNEIQLSS